MSNRHTLSPGTMIRQYRIEAVLGQGGFGITYLAFDTDLQRQVAIKECYPRDFVSREGTTIVPTGNRAATDFNWAMNKFVDEATTVARFRHPGIVQVLQILKDENNSAYMVLEYIDGKSLDQWLKARPAPPEETELKRIIAPMLDALEVVHENGIVHRDIAPDNIFIRKNGQAVLLDFGAAKQIVTQQSRTMNLVVKDGYSAPEQYYAEGRQGPWTDIYSFAAVIYRAMTSKRPVDAMARLDAINNGEPDPIVLLAEAAPRGYSKAFIDAVTEGLSPQVKIRPQNLSQWRSMLIGSAPVRNAASPSPSSISHAPKRKSGSSGMVKVAAAIVLGLGVLGGGLYLSQQMATDNEEADWQTALSNDTPAAITAFLERYPDSARREEAVTLRRAFKQPWSRATGTPLAERANAIAVHGNALISAGAVATSGENKVQGLVQAFSLSGREKWRTEIGGAGSQIINDVLVMANGDIVVAGVSKDKPSAPDRAFVASLSPDGKRKWVKTIGDAQGASIRSLAMGQNGEIIAAGYSASGPNGEDDGWIVRLNSFGDSQSEQFIGGPANDVFNSITLLAGGELILAGEKGQNFWLVKQSSNGETTIDRNPGGGKRDLFRGIAASASGSVIAVGQTESFGSQTVDGMIMHLKNESWKPPKVLAEDRDDYLTSAAVATDGSVFVAGYTSSRGAGQTDGWIRKYDTDLNRVLWERVIGGPGWETVRDVALLPDNSIILAGSTDSTGAGSTDVWLVRMGADGQYAQK